MNDLSDFDIVIRLLTAVLCGGFIGFERDLRRMPTGFRTMAIVGLGACIVAVAAVRHGDSDGFSRVAQGVMTGIGFLGAGVILQHDKIRHVKGLTTAATIWLTAAIGLLCGIGELKLAIIATVIAIIVLLLDYIGSRLWPKLNKPDSNEASDDEFNSRDND